MIGVSIWDLLSPATAAANYHPNTANCIGSCRNERNDAMYLNITGMTCDSCATLSRTPWRKCRACCRRSCPTRRLRATRHRSRHLARGADRRWAGLGYKATPADAPSTSARGNCLARRWDGWAVATRLVVMGRTARRRYWQRRSRDGGGAEGVEQGANVTLIERGTIGGTCAMSAACRPRS